MRTRDALNIALPKIDTGAAEVLQGEMNAAGLRIGIVVSRFNQELTGQLVESALDCLRRHDAEERRIRIVWVPGAYEVPQVIGRLAASKAFDALIALGCVIQGETPHAEMINISVAGALQDVARNSSVPVINEVVGTCNLQQAKERCAYGEGSRGWYAAAAAIETACVFRKLHGATPSEKGRQQ